MNLLLLAVALLALVGIQVLAGGRDILLCLPSYGAIALAAGLSWWAPGQLKISKRLARDLAIALGFFAYVILRALVSEDHYLARRDLYLALAAAVVYLLVALKITTPKSRLVFAAVILTLGVADSLIGLLQYKRGDNFMPLAFLPRADYGNRASGFFGCPNHLAGFLQVALMFGLSITFWSSWKSWIKILAGYACLVCVAGIVLSGSRGGYMSAAAGFLTFVCLSFYVIGKQGRHSVSIHVVTIGFALLLVCWGATTLISEGSMVDAKIKSAVSLGVTHEDARPRLWRAALAQFRLNPIFGTGAGTYLYYGRQFRDPALQSDPVFAHSDYLQLLAEYGIIGFLGFAAFYYVHMRHGWRSLKEEVLLYQYTGGAGQGSALPLTIAALASSVTYTAQTFVDFNLHIPANALLMAFVFGILASPDIEEKVAFKEVPSVSPQWSARVRSAVPVLGLCLAVIALVRFPSEYFAQRAGAILSDSQSFESQNVAQRVGELVGRGLAFDRHNTELYYNLGEGHFMEATLSPDRSKSEEHFLAAIAAYRDALKISPRDVRLWICEATAFDAMQRYADADPVFARALELDPNSANVQCAYAAHLFQQKRFAEAEAEYQKAFKNGSRTALYWIQRIAEMQKAGQLGAAKEEKPPADNGDVSQNP